LLERTSNVIRTGVSVTAATPVESGASGAQAATASMVPLSKRSCLSLSGKGSTRRDGLVSSMIVLFNVFVIVFL
jgi:hypothetical protein